MQAEGFKITDSLGEDILHVTPMGAKTNFQNIRLKGSAQAMKSLQTESIFSLPGARRMKIASSTRNLQLYAASDVSVTSSTGAIEIHSLKDLDLEAKSVNNA